MSGFTDTRRERILKGDVSKICGPKTKYTNSTIVDYNSWIESDKALRLASTLKKDDIIVEGRELL
jgi:hypothetical protein